MNNNDSQTIELQLKAIELLDSVLHYPQTANKPIVDFNFNINLESRVDANKNLVFIIVRVEINTKDLSMKLGSITVSCIFEVKNFNDLVKIDPSGKLSLSKPLIEQLNSIAISTTRGVMFANFKGTFLHNAVLPVVDPSKLLVKS